MKKFLKALRVWKKRGEENIELRESIHKLEVVEFRLTEKVEKLEKEKEELEKEKKDFYSSQLRVYLKKGCGETLKECEQLISTDEGLKHFGEMWGKYKVDTMMMFTAIEYEFLHNYNFTEEEVRVLRHVIGNIGLFFKGCQIAHDSKVELQHLSNIKNQQKP